MMFRACEECNACCSGQLIGDVYGIPMGLGKPCSFLVRGKCTIYTDRPDMCRNYQCAWSQRLFTEDCRPDKIGIMVSVENDNQGQYLKFILLGNDVPDHNIEYMIAQANELNARYVIVPYVEYNND